MGTALAATWNKCVGVSPTAGRESPMRSVRTVAQGLDVVAVLALLLLATTAIAPLARAAERAPVQLTFAGTGTSLAIVRRLADGFERQHPEIRIQVPGSIGSTGGIQAAADGAVALGLIARPLREREKPLGLTVVPFARTGVAIATHEGVADDGITPEDFVSIYAGTKTRWRDGREIIVLARPLDEGLVEELGRRVSGFKNVYAESQKARRWKTLFTDQEMNQMLATTPFAVGFTAAGTVTAGHLPVKMLKVNGVPPTLENVASGRYPLFMTLSFAFIQEKLPEPARAFIEFVRSSEGARILRAAGFAPAG